MTRLEREVRRREQRRLADMNKDSFEIFKVMLQVTLVALALIAGIAIWLWAAAQQAQEVQAAVLRHHRITSANYREIPLVEPLPLTPPEDGEPPQAIEIRIATRTEAVPEEHWESLGTWKLSAYCPESCCNGRGRAWKTASGRPMVVGDTVATSRLPFGTKLKINDHIYTVTDRGVPYGQVDILHESHSAAKRFGIRYAEVFVLK